MNFYFVFYSFMNIPANKKLLRKTYAASLFIAVKLTTFVWSRLKITLQYFGALRVNCLLNWSKFG